MIRSRVVALLVLGGLVLAVAGQGAAQVRYVDETGGVHWAQSAEQVPEKYRSKASEPQLPDVRLKGAQITGNEYAGSSGSSAPSGSPRVFNPTVENDNAFAQQLQERQRQLDEQKRAAAERRARLEAEAKERRAEQRADESLQLQRESVRLQRGRR